MPGPKSGPGCHLRLRLKLHAEEVVVVVQSPSRVQLFAAPWTAAHQAFLSFTISRSLLRLRLSIESVMPSNHLVLCRPLLLLPSIFPSIRVFSKESVFPIRRPKYWSFSFSINPSNEYSGLISFGIDWFDLLAVQGISPESSVVCFGQIRTSRLKPLHNFQLAQVLPPGGRSVPQSCPKHKACEHLTRGGIKIVALN